MESTTFRLNLAKTYINAMEILVEEEVDRRIHQLTENHRAYLNRMELIAYALNHLPSLYATGEKGLEFQLAQGRTQHAARIQQAVQQALSAVLRDPILNYTPLKLHAPAGMREILKRIQVLLHNDKIDWETLPEILEALVRNTSRGTQIAALNGVLSAGQSLGLSQDEFDRDITIGMTSSAPESLPQANAQMNANANSNNDKPWKRVRERIGGKAASGTGTWTDSRYWH
jgi:hypothetical protein